MQRPTPILVQFSQIFLYSTKLPLRFQKQETKVPVHHKRQSFPTCPSILVLVLLPEMKPALENMGISTADFLVIRIQE